MQRRPQTVEHVVEAPHHSRTRRTPLDFAKQRSNAYEADNDDETEVVSNADRRTRPAKGYEPPRSRRQRPPAAARGQVGMQQTAGNSFGEFGKYGSHSDHGSSSYRRGGRLAVVAEGNRSNNSSRSRINGNGLPASQESDSYTSGTNNSQVRKAAGSSSNNTQNSKSASSSRTGSKSNRISNGSGISSTSSMPKSPPVQLPVVPIDYANHPVKAALWMTLQLCDLFRLKQQQQPAGLFDFILLERNEAVVKRQYSLKEAAFVIACDPYKRGKALEQRLWHEILYPCIQALKSVIVSSLSSAGQQRNQAWSLPEVFEAYEMAIIDSQQFYMRLLASVFDMYSDKSSLNCLNQLNIGGTDLSTIRTSGISRAVVTSPPLNNKDEFLRDIMHRCLVFLGDLSRYWCLLYPNEWYLPQHYYAVAHQLNVYNGRPFNQLGKACADASNSLNAIYFYVRAIGTALDGSSGTGADKNLRAFLKHALASYSGVSDNDGVVYIAKTNRSAYVQEMWINLQLVLYAVMFCGSDVSEVGDGDAKKSSSTPPLPSATFFKRACESIVEDFSHAFVHCISAQHATTKSSSGSQKHSRKNSIGSESSLNQAVNDHSGTGNVFELDAEHVWKLLIIVIECVEQAGKRLAKSSSSAATVGAAGDAVRTKSVSGSNAEVWIEIIAHTYSLIFALFERVCDAVDQQLAAVAPQIGELYRVLYFALSSSPDKNNSVLQLLPLSKQLTTSPQNLHYFLTTEDVFSDSEVEAEQHQRASTKRNKTNRSPSTGEAGHQRRRRMQASDSEEEYPALPGTVKQRGSPTSKEVKYPPAYHQLMQTNGWTFDKAIARLYADDEAVDNASELVMSMTDFLPYQLRIEDDEDDEARKSPPHSPKSDSNNVRSTPVQSILRQWRDFSNFELPEPPPSQLSLDAVDFSGGKKSNGLHEKEHEQLWLHVADRLTHLLDRVEYLPCVRLFAAWLLSKRENVEVCHHNYARMLELLASVGNVVAMPRSASKALMRIVEPSKAAVENEFFSDESSTKKQRGLMLADEAHLLGFGALSFLNRLADVAERQNAAIQNFVAGVASVEVVDLATRPAYQLVSLYRLTQYCEHFHRMENVFDDVARYNHVENAAERPVYRVREPGTTEVDRAMQFAVAQSAAAEQERKRATMQKMATLWMQDIQRKVDDELAEEMRQHYERDRPDIPVYLVFDTSCFLDHLTLVSDFIKTQMFHCIVPFAVVDELDMLKQSSKAARDAVRFIDVEQSRQQQVAAAGVASGVQQPPALFKLQAWSETLSGGKTDDAVWQHNHPSSEVISDAKQRSLHFVSDIAECCEYFYAEASLRLSEGGGRDDERELLTLLTAHDDAVSTYAALYRRQLKSLKSGGLNVPVEHIVRLHERINKPYNSKWKTDRLALLA